MSQRAHGGLWLATSLGHAEVPKPFSAASGRGELQRLHESLPRSSQRLAHGFSLAFGDEGGTSGSEAPELPSAAGLLALGAGDRAAGAHAFSEK